MRRYTLPKRISPGSAVQTRIRTAFFASISLKAAISTALHRMNSMLLSAKSTLAPENALAGEPHWKFFPLPVLHFIDYLPLSKAPATAGTPLKTAPSKRELAAAKLLTEGVLSLYAKKHHPAGWCFFAVVILEKSYFFMASSTATATATVAPTIGLLPMPRKPIISTCAGTELEPANCASECIRPMVSVMP